MASLIPSQRHSRTDDPFKSTGSSSSSQNSDINNPKKKWSNWIPLFVAMVVIAEIAFLGRLDMAKNVDLVNSWADSFYQFTTSSWLPPKTYNVVDGIGGGDESGLGVLSRGGFQRDAAKLEGSCEEWLEKEDSVVYSRDFETEPIFVSGAEQVSSCSSSSCCYFKGYFESVILFVNFRGY